MFLRPLNFLLVYIVSILHLALLILPACLFMTLVLKFVSNLDGMAIVNYIIQFWWICLFFISFFCTSYIFADFVFGFTIKSLSRGAKRMARLKEYSELYKMFLIICERFNQKHVELFISNDDEINAYAVGGLRRSVIILTQGLITHISENSENIEDFTKSVSGIIGHEMSHINNMDFLPGIFMHSIKLAIKIVTKISNVLILLPCYLLVIIPVIGSFAKSIILKTYKVINWFSSVLIYNHIILPLHSFLAKALSRSTEYRSDMNSALAIGGECIYLGLEKINFGKSSMWQSVFSTHPSTRSRMVRVLSIEKANHKIMPSVMTEFANMWSLLMLILMTCVLAYKSNAIDIPRYTQKLIILTIEKTVQIKDLTQRGINTGKEVYSLYEKLGKIF